MGIDKTALCGREVVEVVLVELPLLEEAVVRGDALPGLNGLELQRTGVVGAFLEGLGLEGVVFVTDGDGLSMLDSKVHGVSAEAGNIGLEHIAVKGIALLLILGRYSPGDLEARVDEFDLVFRALDDGFVVHLHQLVHVAKAGGGL